MITSQTKEPFALPVNFDENAQQGQTVNFEQTTKSKLKNACVICWETFETKLDFTKHKERTHKDLKSFICRICDRSYNIYDNLRSHVKDKHPYIFQADTLAIPPNITERDVILHPCFTCLTSFSTNNHLITHNNSTGHNFLRSVKCAVCDLTLKLSSSLRKHFHNYHLKEFNELTNKEQTTSENTINNDQEVNNTSTQDQQLRVARLPVQNEHSQPVTQGENPSTSELTVQDIAPLIEDLKKDPNFMYEAFKQVDDKKEAIEGMPSTSANTNMEQDFIDTNNNYFTVQHNQNTTRRKVQATLHPCFMHLISFNQRHDLTLHNRVHHTNLKSFDCGLCDKIYDRYASLRSHMQFKHAKEFKILTGQTT